MAMSSCSRFVAVHHVAAAEAVKVGEHFDDLVRPDVHCVLPTAVAGLRWPPITRQHLEMNEVQMDRMVEVAREAPPLDCAELGLRHGRGEIEQLAVDRPHVPAVLVDGAEVECTNLRGVVRIQRLDRCWQG